MKSPLIIALVCVLVAGFLGYHRLHPFHFRSTRTATVAKPTATPTPEPTATPTPQPTPTPTPTDVPIYVWFNYKYQKVNQDEWLFYYSFTKGEDRPSSPMLSKNLVKCKLNREFVAGLIEKEAEMELEIPSSKCRKIEP